MLAARIPATISDCRKKGLDVQEWVKRGLLDFITLGVHWRGEPAMPVAEFKKQSGFGIPVYASLDDGTYNPREVYSHGMYRGMASHALAQGAAGIYLFNYFFTAYNEAGQKLKPEEGTLVCRTIAPELLQELGSLETLKKRNKVYMLSDGATSYDLTPNSQLPLPVQQNAETNIFVGDDVSAEQPQEVILFIRTNTKDPFSVSINDRPLQQTNADYPRLYDKLRGMNDHQKETAFIVPANAIMQGNNKVAFSSPAGGQVVQRIELALKYGPVEECGYF